MKRLLKAILALLLMISAVAYSATITYNDTQTAIFGSGNPDTGWTTSQSDEVELSLRGKNRITGSTANINGVYTYDTGTVPPANNRAKWNWEWNIEVKTPTGPTPFFTSPTLGDYDYFLGIDTDSNSGPGGVNYVFVDPLTFWSDNSYGDSSTPNGAGLEGLFSAFPSATIAQQSQNLVFAGGNPDLNATYDYTLFAVPSGEGITGNKIAQTTIQVVVGQGGKSVPESIATIPMLIIGASGIIGLAKRQKR